MDKTWIKLYREIADNAIWRAKPFSKGQAWVDLLLMAKYKDEKFLDRRGNLVDGKRGYVYRSINNLSERWGWSRGKVVRFLEVLEKDGMIQMFKKRTSEQTRFLIVNYDKFQGSQTSKRTSDGQVTDKWRTSDGQVADIYKKDKESKERKERKEIYAPPAKSPSGGDDFGEGKMIDFSNMTDEEIERLAKYGHL